MVAGNGTVRAGELLRGLDLPADLVVTSDEWGARKPDPEFFARLAEVAGAAPESTLYVGDHPAEDLFPAAAAGMRTAHLRRGPYGHWWAEHPDVVETADFRIDALTELAGLVGSAVPDAADAADAPDAPDASPSEEDKVVRRGGLRSVR